MDPDFPIEDFSSVVVVDLMQKPSAVLPGNDLVMLLSHNHLNVLMSWKKTD